jgi:6-phosphofructokinase 1
MLYTARCLEMLTEEGLHQAADNAHYMGLDGLVVCGGDGSFRGAQALSRLGVPAIGVPGTIDNDIVCSDYTIGFDTACNTAINAIDRLRDTMQSHERCSVVEVMGRRAGHLALEVGVACGATAILLPEREIDFDSMIVDKMKANRIRGRKHHIIIVAEGVGHAQDVADRIRATTGIDARVTVLGHIQRGGSPTVRDRVMATRMGYHAVRILMEGASNRVVCARNNDITDYDIEEGLAMSKDLSQALFEVSQTVAI